MAAPIRAQIANVKGEMTARPEGLVRHVERVLVEALDLASRWDADAERVELATWGHDLFRAHSPEEQLRLASECGIAVGQAEQRVPVLLHGPIAAVVLRERFGIIDDEALAAVRDHTSGGPAMPVLAKIILLADKVEEHKRGRTPVMREIRRLARRDLDLALLCWADWKWVDERARGFESDPAHWRARASWVAERHRELGMPKRTSDRDFERAAARPA